MATLTSPRKRVAMQRALYDQLKEQRSANSQTYLLGKDPKTEIITMLVSLPWDGRGCGNAQGSSTNTLTKAYLQIVNTGCECVGRINVRETYDWSKRGRIIISRGFEVYPVD